jgi:hypothetical protein
MLRSTQRPHNECVRERLEVARVPVVRRDTSLFAVIGELAEHGSEEIPLCNTSDEPAVALRIEAIRQIRRHRILPTSPEL